MTILIHDLCPLCGKKKGLGKASWSFPKRGKHYEIPFLICGGCGLTISQGNETEIVNLFDQLHLTPIIHDLQQEANNHGA